MACVRVLCSNKTTHKNCHLGIFLVTGDPQQDPQLEGCRAQILAWLAGGGLRKKEKGACPSTESVYNLGICGGWWGG